MRTQLFFVLASLVAAGAGCKWTDFDDLADKTWVHSTDKPNIGSTDYAVAITGVTPPTQTTGGQLAVVSSDVPNYSTLDYTETGDAAVGGNPQKLGLHFISTLSEQPLLVTDGMGKVALVERAIDSGNIAVVLGQANAVSDAPFASTAGAPDAATFVGSNLVVAAGPTFYTVTGMGQPTTCTSMDATLHIAAMASDGTNLWVWTQAGQFGSIPVSALSPCTGGNLPNFGTTFTTPNIMPASPARIHLVGQFAILTGHAASSSAGQVLVVDTSNLTQVGTTLTVEGLKSSAVDTFGGSPYLALGIPSRSVDGTDAGQVEIYQVNATTGMLGSPVETLNDAQPDGGQQFGRTLTTMKFNNKTILVVGAKSEIFAYYKTSLYDALPQ